MPLRLLPRLDPVQGRKDMQHLIFGDHTPYVAIQFCLDRVNNLFGLCHKTQPCFAYMPAPKMAILKHKRALRINCQVHFTQQTEPKRLTALNNCKNWQIHLQGIKSGWILLCPWNGQSGQCSRTGVLRLIRHQRERGQARFHRHRTTGCSCF